MNSSTESRHERIWKSKLTTKLHYPKERPTGAVQIDPVAVRICREKEDAGSSRNGGKSWRWSRDLWHHLPPLWLSCRSTDVRFDCCCASRWSISRSNILSLNIWTVLSRHCDIMPKGIWLGFKYGIPHMYIIQQCGPSSNNNIACLHVCYLHLQRCLSSSNSQFLKCFISGLPLEITAKKKWHLSI